MAATTGRKSARVVVLPKRRSSGGHERTYDKSFQLDWVRLEIMQTVTPTKSREAESAGAPLAVEHRTSNFSPVQSVIGEPRPKRNQSLDVLRCVAILLVLGRHLDYYPLWSKIGWIGVDLFFVLSGFLVSGLLFHEFKEHDRNSIRIPSICRIVSLRSCYQHAPHSPRFGYI